MKKNSGVMAQHSALVLEKAMTTTLCLSLTMAMVVAEGIAEAQQPTRVFRIGYLSPSDPPTESIRSGRSAKDCETWVTSREKTSLLSTDTLQMIPMKTPVAVIAFAALLVLSKLIMCVGFRYQSQDR